MHIINKNVLISCVSTLSFWTVEEYFSHQGFFILFTTIVLVAGAIQGIPSYVDYCNDHDDDDDDEDDDDDDDDFQWYTCSDH